MTTSASAARLTTPAIPEAAWVKAFRALFKLSLGGTEVAAWLVQYLRAFPPALETETPFQQTRESDGECETVLHGLKQWMTQQQPDSMHGLAALRALVGQWPHQRSQLKPIPAAQAGELESALLLLVIVLAAHLAAQSSFNREALNGVTDLVCPVDKENAQWIEQHQVPIAVAVHIFWGLGVAVHKRGERWKVSNMLQTTVLGAVEASGHAVDDPNISRIAAEISALKSRTGSAFSSPPAPTPRSLAVLRAEAGAVSSAKGAALFVLDDAKTLPPHTITTLQGAGLPVVRVSAEDQPQLRQLVNDIREDLTGLLDAKTAVASPPNSISPTKEHNPMQSLTQHFHGPVNAVQTGNHNTQTNQQTIGSPAPSLAELIAALQQLQALLPPEHPQKQVLPSVIEIAQNKEEEQSSAQRTLKGFLQWLKQVAKGTESVGTIVDNTGKAVQAADAVHEQAVKVLALAAPYWPQIAALLN